MKQDNAAEQETGLKVERDGARTVFFLRGNLEARGGGGIWKEAVTLLENEKPRQLIVDGDGVTYCDVAGIGLLIDLKARQEEHGGTFEVRNFPEKYRRLLDLFPPDIVRDTGRQERARESIPDEVGRAAASWLGNLRTTVAFIGELSSALFFAVLHPAQARWNKCWGVMEAAGVNALPIIALMGFLIGLILAFQAGVPMRQYGADIFIINLVAITLVRELGPLITAIIVAGRSGSSFAAEIGTMKVNDEVNALITMGLNPVKFLAVPKVLAGILVMPLLTIFTNIFGMIGAIFVVMGMGYPLITCLNRLVDSVSVGDLLGGLFKTLVFGLLISGVGCLRGLQTKAGAQSVGVSTTQAVVSGIILIIFSDGIFAVIFYYLGI
ncbi:MAG: MlaE family lipid ABC transporter permease subunit [PVC group bacterium]